MAKQSLAIVQNEEIPGASMIRRVDQAMRSKGWALGVIRARRQFADQDRGAALEAAGLGDEHRALSLHIQADQHEAAVVRACEQLGRLGR